MVRVILMEQEQRIICKVLSNLLENEMLGGKIEDWDDFNYTVLRALINMSDVHEIEDIG